MTRFSQDLQLEDGTYSSTLLHILTILYGTGRTIERIEMEELQKSRFLSLYCMMLADGIVQAKELEVLYRIGQENYHLTSDEINKTVVTAGTSFIAPERIEDKIAILYEMAEIAWADGEIDETEKSLLARYAIRLGFKEENAIGIAEFMLQQVKDGVSQEEVINQIINA